MRWRYPMDKRKQLVPRDCVDENLCPKCGGELDTGRECNDCGYDAMWAANLSGGQTQQ